VYEFIVKRSKFGYLEKMAAAARGTLREGTLGWEEISPTLVSRLFFHKVRCLLKSSLDRLLSLQKNFDVHSSVVCLLH